MACMTAAQHSSIDMLMYYDTRQSPYCGLFDFYTYKPLKGYYPFKWYGMFYDMEAEIKCSTEIKDIYTLCGVDSNNKTLTVITYYTDNDTAENKTVNIDFSKSGKYEIYLLDNEHDAELIGTTDELTFDMKPNTCVLVKEIVQTTLKINCEG